MSFKVGDIVYVTSFSTEPRVIIEKYGTNEFKTMRLSDSLIYTIARHPDELVLKEVYESPLYQLMKEMELDD